VADGIKFGSVVLGYSRIAGSFGYHRTDVNLGDSSGWAPLRFAVRWGYRDVTWLPLGDRRSRGGCSRPGERGAGSVDSEVVGLLVKDGRIGIDP